MLPPTKKRPCNLICCQTDSNVGGKTRNIALLVLQQCCKTSWTFYSHRPNWSGHATLNLKHYIGRECCFLSAWELSFSNSYWLSVISALLPTVSNKKIIFLVVPVVLKRDFQLHYWMTLNWKVPRFSAFSESAKGQTHGEKEKRVSASFQYRLNFFTCCMFYLIVGN